MKKHNKQKSFTLIELMTVIGIIAILAGLMLVGYNIFFSEANIGSSMRFDSSIHHSLGYALVGDWKMDDNAANSTVVDTSGNGNDGTFHNAANNYTSENSVDGANGRALHFDGSGDECITTPLSVDISNTGYTVSVWAKSEGDDDKYEVVVGDTESGHTWFLEHARPTSTDDWHYAWKDSTDSWQHIYSNKKVTENKWYYLVAVNDGNNQFMYVNGIKQNETVVNGFDSDIFKINIGSTWSGGGMFKGIINQVRVYKAVLSASRI